VTGARIGSSQHLTSAWIQWQRVVHGFSLRFSHQAHFSSQHSSPRGEDEPCLAVRDLNMRKWGALVILATLWTLSHFNFEE
jgi:hypothetical protein